MAVSEKEATLRVEDDDSNAPEEYIEYDEQETRKILWKVDWRLVPFLSVLYL